MASYDSDSSMEGGEDDYTETNVLLGYASKEPADDTISYLGGRPTWLDPATPPSAALARCKVCNDIMALLLQLNGGLPDIYPDHERRLYLFACRRKTCRRKEGSVRVVRGIRGPEETKESRQAKEAKKREEQLRKEEERKRAEEKKNEPPSRALGESLFGAKPSSPLGGPVNPFATGGAGAPVNPFAMGAAPAASNPFAASGMTPLSELAAKPPQAPEPQEKEEKDAEVEKLPKTFADALNINNDSQPVMGPPPPPEPWPEESKQQQPFPKYYLIDVDYEQLDKVEHDIKVPIQTMEIDEGAGASGGSGGGKEDKEVYESTIDKTFQKFADRLAQNPEQVIRYEFRGQPLLYSKTDAVGKLLSPPAHDAHAKVTTTFTGGNRLPRCKQCGSARTFEMQLTPHAIAELEAEQLDLEGMDWGTILVAVCDRDCVPAGGAGYVEEWVGVQWEELDAKR